MAKNQIIFTRTQFIGILLSAVVTGAVSGIFGTLRTINSDHFTLLAVAQQIAENKQKDENEHKTYVTREELRELVIQRMDRIQASVDRLR